MPKVRIALMSLSLAAVIAGPALAAEPKDGAFKGTAKYTACGAGGCPAKLTLTVKNGKITKFVYKIPQVKTTVTVKPKKAIAVNSKGKFNYAYSAGDDKKTLKGQFTSASKVTGTYEAKGQDDINQSVPKTKFTLKRK